MEFFSDKRGGRKDETQEGPVDKETRYNRRDHLPACSEMAVKCGVETCDSKSFVFCYKCKVYLCLEEDKNCFQEYHYK